MTARALGDATRAIGRRTFLGTGASVFAVTLTAARISRVAATERDQVIEDWHGSPVGSSGVPPSWSRYETPGGHPAYDFTIVRDDGRPSLRLKSASEHSTIAKEIRVDLAATPSLRWDWKVLRFPAGADLRVKRALDATAHVFVIWPRFPEMLRSRLIGYVWDATLPAGSIVQSVKAATVTYVVTRAGSDGLGIWQTETRNVVADYRRIFKERPPNPRAIALSIDTNDTRSLAEALVGRIAFVAG
jgi:hypothetical protein